MSEDNEGVQRTPTTGEVRLQSTLSVVNSTNRSAFNSRECLPELELLQKDLTISARALAQLLADTGRVFDRAGPVVVVPQTDQIIPEIKRLNGRIVAHLAHKLCQPVRLNKHGEFIRVTLPARVAQLCLDHHEWRLRRLNGITTAPLLSSDGRIRSVRGYDPQTGLWCACRETPNVPAAPTRAEAEAALLTIRRQFQTFPFAGAAIVPSGFFQVVDLERPPAEDESAFLAALVTAICRPSLPLVPGLLIVAPAFSGAGTGKGILVRAISQISYGLKPHAMPPGANVEELEKRIVAALLQGAPVIFVDNVNGATLKSDLLASILTEAQVDVRPLGRSEINSLCPNAFVAITGNGLRLSEDLARRFIVVLLDTHTADPEARPFAEGFLDEIAARAGELRAAALTVWRWGRQNQGGLKRGRSLGSYEAWALWVRDPLLTLGCADPVERVGAIKAQDPARREVAELFHEWWLQHGAKPMKAAELALSVRGLIDPQGRGRQFIAAHLRALAGTTLAGFILTAQEPTGKWGATTYALKQVQPDP